MENKHIFIPYITAGFPSKKSFLQILKIFSRSGADFIEVGVPHSDPLADGPVIQESSKMALENGVNLKWIVETLRTTPLRRQIKPLILFSYLNPILNYGFEKLLKDLPKPLFQGLIIPDLPLEEAKKYLPLLKRHKLNLIPLIAPTTEISRMKKIISAYCSPSFKNGFIYLVSVAGVTGIRRKINTELKTKIKEIKSVTKTPVVVGFGISNSEHAREVISYGADGVIIGSALIKVLKNIKDKKLLKLKNFLTSLKINLS